MKKVVGLLCGVFLLSACSDENNTETEINNNVESIGTIASKPLPPVETEVDSMFYNYVTSDIFLEVKGLISDFNEDLNYDGEDEEWLWSDEDMFDWITVNLSQTNFADVNEAQVRWSQIKNRVSLKADLFSNIYEFIGNEPEEVSVPVIKKWLVEPITTADDDGKNCANDFDYCTNRVAEQYAQTERSIQEGINPPSTRASNDQTYENEMDRCRRVYKSCIGAT